MNQTSDKFFDEMLKDNVQEQPQGDFQEQLANMIDKRITETMKKFEDQFNQIKQPQTDPAEAAAAAADVAKGAAADAAQEQKFQEDLDSIDAGKTESGLLTEG